MHEVYLIDEKNLKLYSPISRNVSIEKLIPFVSLAQTIYIQPVLGNLLYTKLQEAVKAGEISPSYQALLIKIWPALAMATSYVALRPLTYTLSEKGVTKLKSQNSEAISSEELGYYAQDLKNQMNILLKQLEEYLETCDVEGYTPKGCACDKAAVVDYQPMIYIPKHI